MGEAYGRLGTRFRKQEGEAYSKIVRDYPMSDYADDAARKLKELEMPVPEADKGAVARMQYEKDHKVKPGIITRDTQWLKRGPDMSTAARSGDPAMTTMRPSVPPLVPQAPGATGAFNGEVTAERVGNSTALDTKPDARANPPAAGAAPAASGAAATPAADASQPQTTQQSTTDANAKKKKKSKKQQPAAQPADAAPPAAAQPAAAAPASAPSN